MKTIILLIPLVLINASLLVAQTKERQPLKKTKSNKWEPLIDQNLSRWEVWTGTPEPSVKNLPASYTKDANGNNATPIGLGDPMGIYSVTKDQNGDFILNISGQVYAGLTSKASFSNYHLTFLFKWGEQKYEPRIERKRDSGVLYHCHGPHGVFWNVWKSCLEFQVQEGDFGDLYNLAGTAADVSVDNDGIWHAYSKKSKKKNSKKSGNFESPHGEWSRVDIYTVGDKAIHLTNGQVVLALKNAKASDGTRLDSGQIQIQSESAECFIKDINIRSISRFPKKIKRVAGL